MMPITVFLQAMMLSSMSVCWADFCSSDGEPGVCGTALSGVDLDEVVATAIANITLLFPGLEEGASSNCQLTCWDGEAEEGGTMKNASERVKELTQNLDVLIDKMKEEIEKNNAERRAVAAVKNFTILRDWTQIKEVLVPTLEPGDPALEQAQLISYTDGKDALMEIVYSGHTELLQKLLDLGLDANVPWGINNSTMLHAVASTGAIDVAEVLFSRGALIDTYADWNVTALLRAAASHQPKMVRWLLDHGADVHVADTNGWTSLHYAAKENDLETVKILVEANVVKEAPNGKGNTAYDEALAAGHKEVSDILAPESPFDFEVEAE